MYLDCNVVGLVTLSGHWLFNKTDLSDKTYRLGKISVQGDFILSRNLVKVIMNPAPPPNTHVIGHAQTSHCTHEHDGD